MFRRLLCSPLAISLALLGLCALSCGAAPVSNTTNEETSPVWPGRLEVLPLPLPLPGLRVIGFNETVINGSAAVSVLIPLPQQVSGPVFQGRSYTAVMMLLMIIPCCLACGFAAFIIVACIRGCTTESNNNAQAVGCTSALCEGAEGLGDDTRLRHECLLMLVAQWAAFGISCLAGKIIGRVPGVLALMAIPWLARNIYLEHAYLKHKRNDYNVLDPNNAPHRSLSRNSTWATARKIIFLQVLPKLEILDAFSDGIAAASALFLSMDVKRRFVHRFTGDGGNPAVAWLAGRLGLRGFMVLTLVYSTVVQSGMTFAFSRGSGSHVILADMAGYAAMAEHEVFTVEDETERRALVNRKNLFVGLARTYGEAAWQALLQTSLVMAVHAEIVQQPLILFSILMSCATIASRAASMTKTLLSMLWESMRTHHCSCQIALLLLMFAIIVFLTWGILVLALAKLYFAEACPDRSWGLARGCV